MTGLLLSSIFAIGQIMPPKVAIGPGHWVPQPGHKVLSPAPAGDEVLRWNEIVLQAIRAERSPPPIATRCLAMMHLAVYDAVNAVFRTHTPYSIDVQAVPGASAEAAAAAAAHRVLSKVYPGLRRQLDANLEASFSKIPEAGRDAGAQLGVFVADKILEERQDDGSSSRSDYQPRLGIGLWRPTPAAFQAPLLPHWGCSKTFAVRADFRFCPPGPPPLQSAAYAGAYREVRALGARDSQVRTPEQTKIALFWADDVGTVTPPGHWNQVAQSVARSRGLSLAENARLFALLNLGLADAGILCWWCKFTHDFWRPVTAIQLSDETGNPERPGDPSWMPLLATPPFPSYTSGHSTFSATAASVLAKFFGNDQISFESASEGLPGFTRTFPSFSVAAREAGMSRIYGGIHWQFDNVDALGNGRDLGEYVCGHFLRPCAAP
jgi:hypothetical protein